MEWISLVTLIGNVIIPPAFNLIKSFFGKKDTPEQTISNLATTKPEVLPAYIEAQAKLLEAETKFFQRDISGTPSKWVVDFRASIRPASVILAFIILGFSIFTKINISLPIILTCQTVIGNWIGAKIEVHQ